MGNKSYTCDRCSKILSSYHSLWRHKRNGICHGYNNNASPIDEKREADASSGNRFLSISQPDSSLRSLWNYEQKCFNPKVEVNDSNEDDKDEDVQLTDRYEPQETCIDQIGSNSLNPTQYIHSSDDSSVEDQPEGSIYNTESMSRDTESSIYDIPNYSWCDDGAIKKNHSFQLPRDIRAIIVGKSGSGKTTLLCHLLMAPDVLDYNNLMVCGKSLHQPSYKIMQLGFDKGLSKTNRKDVYQTRLCNGRWWTRKGY